MRRDSSSISRGALPSPVLVVLPTPETESGARAAEAWVRRLEEKRVDAVITRGDRRQLVRALVAVRPEAAVALDQSGKVLLTELAPDVALLV